jgi:hypothetical protein
VWTVGDFDGMCFWQRQSAEGPMLYCFQINPYWSELLSWTPWSKQCHGNKCVEGRGIIPRHVPKEGLNLRHSADNDLAQYLILYKAFKEV